MAKRFHSVLRSSGLRLPKEIADPIIERISSDSRSIKNGTQTLFLGLPGENTDGGFFWPQAISSGAVAAVISQNAAEKVPPLSNDLVFVLPDPPERWIGEIASAFWGKPSTHLDLIGVTGTNGKTTITHLIEHLSKSVGKPSAVFGTLVNRWPNYSETAIHTTTFADTLQANLAKALEAGARIGAMEVSSHALVQQRVAGCQFAGAIFTNLTQDHLDYHSSMDDYFEAKSLLFSSPLLSPKSSKPIINIDDNWGLKLSKRLGGNCWRCSLGGDAEGEVELFFSELSMSSFGVKGTLHSPFGSGLFKSPLLGEFNLMNLLQSVGALLQEGLPLDDLLNSISDFPGVPGRMQLINILDSEYSSSLPTVLVDYAHTPDALKNTLLSLRPLTKGKLICLFGCGGDRDRGKRSQMGEVASIFSDKLVITSDNPRSENPSEIINDILQGIKFNVDTTIQSDRSKAIELAIFDAGEDDLVLIAGKGHEDYQLIGDSKFHFDDGEQATNSLHLKLNSLL